MTKYERILQTTVDSNVNIHDFYLGDGIKGLYINGNIALSKDLETSTKKACILAEELGHHYTTVGNILDLSQVQNRKQEHHARFWAYNRMAILHGLIGAYEYGCTQRHEIAEYLEVTEEFLYDAVECYRNKYGICKIIGNHIIYFIPHLTIGRII